MDFLLIPGVIFGVWIGCKVLGAIGLLISDLWNTFTRR